MKLELKFDVEDTAWFASDIEGKIILIEGVVKGVTVRINGYGKVITYEVVSSGNFKYILNNVHKTVKEENLFSTYSEIADMLDKTKVELLKEEPKDER